MEPVLLLGAVVAFAGAVVLSARQLRARASEWRFAAEECGLRVVAHPGLLRRQMKAVSKSARVEFTLHVAHDDRVVTRIEIRPRNWAHPDFRVRAPNLRFASVESSPATEIPTGDVGFDVAAHLSGSAAPALAAMNHAARSDLIAICRDASLHLNDGRVTVLADDEQVEGYLRKFLETLLRFTDRMAAPFEVADELSRNVREDRAPGVREQSLVALARGFPELPVTRQVLLEACGDPSPAVRLAAGRELREEGVPILLALVEEESAIDGVSASAALALGRRLPSERLEPLLKWALRKRRLTTAKALAELAGRIRVAAAAPVLARILEVEGGELAMVAAKALGATGESKFEAALIGGLRKGSLELALAATAALERVGSAAAVMPLKELARRRTMDSSVQRAVGQAIAAIRARAPGASPGQLSLAAVPTGQLSLVPDAAGNLSFAGDEAGRLSPVESRPAAN